MTATIDMNLSVTAGYQHVMLSPAWNTSRAMGFLFKDCLEPQQFRHWKQQIENKFCGSYHEFAKVIYTWGVSNKFFCIQLAMMSQSTEWQIFHFILKSTLICIWSQLFIPLMLRINLWTHTYQKILHHIFMGTSVSNLLTIRIGPCVL